MNNKAINPSIYLYNFLYKIEANEIIDTSLSMSHGFFASIGNFPKIFKFYSIGMCKLNDFFFALLK